MGKIHDDWLIRVVQIISYISGILIRIRETQ